MLRGERRTPRRQRRRQAWLAVEVVCGVLFLAAAVLIANKAWRAREVRREEAAARALEGQIHQADLPGASGSPAGDSPSADDPAEPPRVDGYFLELLEQNPDTVGLVTVNGDQTMYVCQADDNLYYLNHRFDRSEDPAGMIFMDCRNSIWPASDNIILYGHDMRIGSRFGELKRYQKRAYLDEHPTIRFTSLYESRDYVPFAVVLFSVGDPEHYFFYAKSGFESEDDFSAFVADARERSVYPIDCDVRYGDKLLTLVTCSSDLDGGRLVILCRQTAR